MPVGVLYIHLYLPGCASLKEKRSHLKPLLARLHREFNVSAAEIEKQDMWNEAVIACALISNDANHIQSSLQHIAQFTENTWRDLSVIKHHIELI